MLLDPTLVPVAVLHLVLREVPPFAGRGVVSDAFPS